MKNFIERVACPTCNNKTNQRIIYSKEYKSDKIRSYLTNFYTSQGTIDYSLIEHAIFEVVECRHCLLVYQKYIPDDFLLNQVYEKWIDPLFAKKRHILRKNKKRLGLNLQESIKEKGYLMGKYNLDSRIKYEVNMVKSFFPKSAQLSFLDFGMGWADFLIQAKKAGVRCYGSELSKERIEYATKKGIKIVNYDQIPNFKFDYVHTQQVFEHLCYPLDFLKTLVSSLRVGGIILLSVPNGYNVKKALGVDYWNPNLSKSNSVSVNPISPLEHLNAFNYDSLLSFAKNNGLTRIRPKLLSYLRYNDFALEPFNGAKNIFRNLMLTYLDLHQSKLSMYFIKK